MRKSYLIKAINVLQLITFLGFTLIMRNQLDIIQLLAFTILPLVIGMLLNFIDVKFGERNSDKTLFLTYFTSGVAYLILSVSLFSGEAAKERIIDLSQKYSSDYVTITQNESPIVTLVVTGVFVAAVHYMISNQHRGGVDFGEDT